MNVTLQVYNAYVKVNTKRNVKKGKTKKEKEINLQQNDFTLMGEVSLFCKW